MICVARWRREEMVCDICGSREVEYKAIIEGTELEVCSSCAKHGKIISRIGGYLPSSKQAKGSSSRQTFVVTAYDPPKKTETLQVIVPNFAAIVKNAREKKDLKQEEAAKLINEKGSVYQKIENGSHEPDLVLARKLEKFFGITLVQEHEEFPGRLAQKKEKVSGSASFTLGDFVRKRKKKQ